MRGQRIEIDLEALFDVDAHEADLDMSDCRRIRTDDGKLDWFEGGEGRCCFRRFAPEGSQNVGLRLTGEYAVRSVDGGGWMLRPDDESKPWYWVPVAPIARRINGTGQILEQRPAEIGGLEISQEGLSLTVAGDRGFFLDLVVWRFSGGSSLIDEIAQVSQVERQPYFLWSSHTRFARPADLYAHLVFGICYENQAIWPRYVRICSELDAYALYSISDGLDKATGKRIYRLFKQQIAMGVVERQSPDGGWYHGEWTESMEAHYRLATGGLRVLTACAREFGGHLAADAGKRAVQFLMAAAQDIDDGLWLMHDSLEASVEALSQYPFGWSRSNVLGKSPSNLMVLNTHLDSLVAIAEWRDVSGDAAFDASIERARSAADRALRLAPLEGVYRWIFKAIDLSLLEKSKAKRLPLALKILKRIGWKYLEPNLHLLKCRFPRFVMPNGYVDRAICQHELAHRYQSVHAWDVARYLRWFPSPELVELRDRIFEYTQEGPIRGHWRDARERHDAFGFWVDALCELYRQTDDRRYLNWLVEGVIDSMELGIGLAPSCLGTDVGRRDSEALATAAPCSDVYLVRLTDGNDNDQLLLVNVGGDLRRMEASEYMGYRWEDLEGTSLPDGLCEIEPRNAVVGIRR